MMSYIFQSIKPDFILLFFSSLIFHSGFPSIVFLFHEFTIPFLPFSRNFCLIVLWPCNLHSGHLLAVPDLCFSH